MSDPDSTVDSITRRAALAGALGAAATVPLGSDGEAEARGGRYTTRTGGRSNRMPTVFIPHGGGPWPFVDLGFGHRHELDSLAAYLRSLAHVGGRRPEAVLMVSAHWEEPQPTVMTGAQPPLLFDYYGFPAEAYQLSWPAPGHPGLAAQVRTLLGAAGFATGEDAARGFDHGAFVPLKLTWPGADMPTVQLSLKQGLDPAEHLALGRALAPLREDGVLILGSGLSYHNLQAFRGGGEAASREFDAWLQASMRLGRNEREARLVAWESAPSARACHPREEHLLPLMVAAGAGLEDPSSIPYSATLNGMKLSAIQFG